MPAFCATPDAHISTCGNCSILQSFGDGASSMSLRACEIVEREPACGSSVHSCPRWSLQCPHVHSCSESVSGTCQIFCRAATNRVVGSRLTAIAIIISASHGSTATSPSRISCPACSGLASCVHADAMVSPLRAERAGTVPAERAARSSARRAAPAAVSPRGKIPDHPRENHRRAGHSPSGSLSSVAAGLADSWMISAIITSSR